MEGWDLYLMIHGTYFTLSSFDYLLNYLNMLTKQSTCDMTLKFYILQVEQEIALLSELKHTNIVQFFGTKMSRVLVLIHLVKFSLGLN
jgi:cytochrome c oxidase subunit IV